MGYAAMEGGNRVSGAEQASKELRKRMDGGNRSKQELWERDLGGSARGRKARRKRRVEIWQVIVERWG